MDDEKTNENELKKLDEEFGWIPSSHIGDPYRKNIVWLLKKYEQRFDENGRLSFKAKALMKKFGEEENQMSSFVNKHRQKIDVINRNDEYDPWVLYCGTDGVDPDGDTIFFYQRFGKDSPTKKDNVVLFEKEELTYGKTSIKSDILKGAEIEKGE